MADLKTPDDYDRIRLWLAATPRGREIIEGREEEFLPTLLGGSISEFEMGMKELGYEFANIVRVKSLALDWYRREGPQRGRLSRIDLALLRAIEHWLSMGLSSPPVADRLQALDRLLANPV